MQIVLMEIHKIQILSLERFYVGYRLIASAFYFIQHKMLMSDAFRE